MKSPARKAVAFLLFIAALAALLWANSKALNLFSICLIAAFGLVASGAVVIKTFAGKGGESYSRAGWGNPISVLPASWQRWLLDEHSKDARRAG